MRLIAFFLAVALAVAAGPVRAQQPPPDDLPRIRISGPERNLLRMAAPNAVGDGAVAGQATTIERRDLTIVGLFEVLNPASFPPDLQNEGLGFSSALWSQVAAQGVTKLKVSRDASGLVLEGRLYHVGQGENPLLTKVYRGPDLRGLVHRWVNDVIEHYTNVRGVLGSRIAFAQTGHSTEVASVGMDGADLAVLTKMKSDCLLPAYSPTGREVAFTSYLFGGADLWLVSAAGGRARRISSRPGMNSGATWFADGTTLAMTLSHEGNPEIYKIRADSGAVVARLTHSSGSDLSPSLSPDGAQIAFVSDRQGTPQIFVMPASGGNARRLTFQGVQNTTPRFNPAPDKPLIAFTGRDEKLVFDIFVFDLRTQKVDRITQNEGSNYDPSWSPDGRLLVYASNRGGLFVRNPQTRVETQIHRGGAQNTSWGPAPVVR
jgi:TolB protein